MPFFTKVLLRFSLVALHGSPCSATRENLNKTIVKNSNPKFSYRNNENCQTHHGLFSNKHVELVYTKYEVKRSIILKGGWVYTTIFRAQNPVFDTLTPDGFLAGATDPLGWETTYEIAKQRMALMPEDIDRK